MRWRLALVGLLLFRLGFGLTADFWTEDERQVYLIGLRSYARGEWPYFGADVVWTQSQLPGALQGLLVAGPLRVWPVPESPIVLLNLISFGALCLLAWYCERRVSRLPRWLVWGLVLTSPWVMYFSTHIVNTSYILAGAVVFFVGFFEAVPSLTKRLIDRRVAFAMMGFGLFWLVQIHLSWVLLPPYVAFAFLAGDTRRRLNPRALARVTGSFALGSLAGGCLLLPTLFVHGLGVLSPAANVQPHALGPAAAVTILARFLSFPSFELVRFLGLDTAQRLAFLAGAPWLIPLALVLVGVGIVQAVALAVLWFHRRHGAGEWRAIRMTALLTVVWIYVSFLFSIRAPLAHSFYVTAPVAIIYSTYCWDLVAARTERVNWRAVAAVVLACGTVFHAGVALARRDDRSLAVNRHLVRLAIDARDDRLLGNRRTDHEPPWDPRSASVARARDSFLSAKPASDLETVELSWTRGAFGKVSSFRVALRNRSTSAAYLDIQLATSYTGTAGTPLRTGRIILKEILQPGELRTWDVVDGLVPPGAVNGTTRVINAEKCVPAKAAGLGVPPENLRGVRYQLPK